MRSVSVSTEVFAAIWAARQNGEDGEDAILARLLKVAAAPDKSAPSRQRPKPLGYFDHRYGFQVPEGFEVFRTFKGVPHKAVATGWKWRLEPDGRLYDSLSALSEAVGARAENAWVGWLCQNSLGATVPVGSLRATESIRKRNVSSV
jgi:hypothetical protein